MEKNKKINDKKRIKLKSSNSLKSNLIKKKFNNNKNKNNIFNLCKIKNESPLFI